MKWPGDLRRAPAVLAASWSIALGALPCAPAHAQFMKREYVFGAGGGWAFPTGLLADRAKTGSGGSVAADYQMSPSWALGVRAGSVRFEATDSARSASGLRRTRFVSAELHARLYLYPESWFSPYAAGGLGLVGERRWSGAGATIFADDATRIGLSGGVGLSAHREGRRWTLYSELIYQHLPASEGSRQYIFWCTGLRVSFGGRPF